MTRRGYRRHKMRPFRAKCVARLLQRLGTKDALWRVSSAVIEMECERESVSAERTFTHWHRLSLLLLAALGLGQLLYWTAVADHIEKPLDTACAAWDRDASARVAELVLDSSTMGESRLDEALSRLRRARQNCRAGWLEVARHDYSALRDTLASILPVTTSPARP